jgi:hypothetical protein
MTWEELERKLPNGFHDAKIFSLELNYAAGTAKFNVSLLVGRPEDSSPERQAYQQAMMTVTGLCFCSIGPPSPDYPFIPYGNPISVSGDPAKPDHLPFLTDLVAKLPAGTWCHRFFVHEWNAFIHLAARDVELEWVGDRPKHAM